MEPQLAALIEKGDVSFDYRHLIVKPPRSQWAAEATECAADQGQFWSYHDMLFTKQRVAYDLKQLKAWGKEMGLDEQKFTTCLDQGTYKGLIGQYEAEAVKLGINSTPTFVLNGKVLSGYTPEAVVLLVKQAVNQK